MIRQARLLLVLFAFFALCFGPNRGRAATNRVNQKLTITAGTPVQIAPLGTMADEILIQPLPGGTVGLVYVMAGIVNRTPATSNAADVTAQLCAATATAPGCTYTDGTLVQQSTGVDAGTVWIDVATSNTVVYASYQPR